MDGFSYVDIFATKGIEYLFVILFFILLVPFWMMLQQPSRTVAAVIGRQLAAAGEWFRLQTGAFFHQGHTWAMPDDEGLIRVGVDDFAQKLVGTSDGLRLPAVGTLLTQGEQGWELMAGAKAVPMLSPVSGEVVAVNEAVLAAPSLLNRDPYEAGWLMKIRMRRGGGDLRNLLSGRVAVAWMEETVKDLRARLSGELGLALQDGGVPVSGFAREISGEDWDEIAAEYFLSR